MPLCYLRMGDNSKKNRSRLRGPAGRRRKIRCSIYHPSHISHGHICDIRIFDWIKTYTFGDRRPSKTNVTFWPSRCLLFVHCVCYLLVQKIGAGRTPAVVTDFVLRCSERILWSVNEIQAFFFEQKLIFDNRLRTATWKMWPSAVGCLNIACAHMMARTSLILLVVVPTCVHFWFRFLTRRGIFVVVRFATG